MNLRIYPTLVLLLVSITPAFAADDVDKLLPPSLLPCDSARWERQQGKRLDFQDELPWHGCVYDSSRPDREKALVFAHRADNLAASGHFDEAFEQITEALKLDPAEFEWLLFRAKMGIRIEKEQQAKEDLRAAISLECSDSGAQFEVERLLVKLGEYRLVADTIPPVLPKLTHTCPPDTPAAFQYLLAYSEEQLGEFSSARDDYAKAARYFLTQGIYGAGCACLKHIHGIESRTGLYLQGTDDLKKFAASMTGVGDLKEMVAQIVTSQNCLNPQFVEKATRCKLKDLKKGEYYSEFVPISLERPAAPPPTGFAGAELSIDSPQLNMLRIYLVPEDCRLTMAELTDIIGGRKLVDGHERWSIRSETTRACKIPSGTLYFCLLPEMDNSVVCITVVDRTPDETVLTPEQIELNRQNGRRGIGYQIASGNFAEGLRVTAEWVTDDPTNVDAEWMRANALTSAGKFKEAMEPIEFVIKYAETAKDGNRFSDQHMGNLALIRKGICQTGLGEYAEALETFKIAFPKKLNSDNYFNRAQAEIGLGQLQEAASDLESAVGIYFDEARIVRRDEAKKLLEETQNKISNAEKPRRSNNDRFQRNSEEYPKSKIILGSSDVATTGVFGDYVASNPEKNIIDEHSLLWDCWKKSVEKAADERFHKLAEKSLGSDTGHLIVSVSYVVSNKGKITFICLGKKSTNEACDSVALQSVMDLSTDPKLLKFPDGATESEVKMRAVFQYPTRTYPDSFMWLY